MTDSTHDVTVLGARTRYWEYGTRGDGPTIVVVHGYRGDHHGLAPVIERLDGFHVVSPDLPGFGESAALPGEHSIAGYGAWLTAFLAETDLTGTTLLGHSFGSIVVSHAVAAGLPARALILVNPISADPSNVVGIGLTRLFYGIGRRLPERAARAWLSNGLVVRGMSARLATTRDRRLRRFIHGQHDAYFSRFATRRSVMEGFDASLSTDVSVVAERIHQPVLLIAGEVDEIAPLASQTAVRALFPDATLQVIPGVGHLIHYEAPDVAADAIRSFLLEHVR